MNDQTLTQHIQSECDRLGFARFGVCAAEPVGRADFWQRYIAEGRQGEMGYLAETLDIRLDPKKLLPAAKSILMVADLYHRKGENAQCEGAKSGMGRIARYARGRDYHKSLKKRLHALADQLRTILPGEEFRVAVDTAPLAEREHAARAGLGWIAKHTLLIHPELGSYFFLGAILTTAALPIPAGQVPVTDHCGGCTACIDACPTEAIRPYEVDARRCISYLTIEGRGEIVPDLQVNMGDWLFGCDICQEVCPHNSVSALADSSAVHADYQPRRSTLPLRAILDWQEADRREIVRGTALGRAKGAMWRRNAIICLGNDISGNPDPRLLERLSDLAASAEEPAPVRQAAREALGRLDRRDGNSAAQASPF